MSDLFDNLGNVSEKLDELNKNTATETDAVKPETEENAVKPVGNASDPDEKAKPAVTAGRGGAADLYEKMKPAVNAGLENAAELYEKVKPAVNAGLGKAKEGVQTAYEKAAPIVTEGLGKALEGVQPLFGKAKPVVEKFVDDVKSAADRAAESKKEKVEDSDSELDAGVAEQIEKIRAAASQNTIISDFVHNAYGNTEKKTEAGAEEKAGDAEQ